jgi:AsmA protein
MRWIVRIALTLVVLIVIAVGALALLPTERIARIATDRFTAATGRSMTVSGDLRPAFWPALGLSAGGIEIGNADWSDAGPMLRAGSVEMGVDLAALFSGDIRIQSILIDSPEIILQRDADGRANWDFTAPGADRPTADNAAVGGGPDLSRVSLEEMRITNARLIYDDRAAGARHELSGIDARIRLPAATGAGEATLSAQMNGVALGADVTIAQMAPFLSGKASQIALTATAGRNTLSYDGSAGFAPIAAQGALDVALPDISALAALANAGPVSLPAGLGNPGLSGDVSLSETGAVALRQLVLTSGQSRLTGTADLATSGPRPRLTADLSAGTLDLSAFTGGAGDGPTAAPGWSRDPIDASALRAIDAEMTFRADAVNLGATSLGRTALGLTVDNGRLVTRLREVRAFAGNLTGEMVVNARSGLSIAGDLTLVDLALRPALSTLANMNRLVGTGNGAVKFQSSGASVDALMKGLAGSGNLAFTDGEILGLDLVGMLRTLDTSYMGPGSKTIFDSITGTFTIKDGVLTNNDMAMAAPLIRAEGAGTVNIGAQSLNYRVTPIALSGADGAGGLRVPLLITGPWAAPRYKLDLEGAAKQNLAKEREALEQKAREAVGSRLEGLGLKPKESDASGATQTPQQKIEDKAKGALKGLLGR